MTAAELREKVRLLVPTLVGNRKQAEKAAIEFDELTKFPELKKVIVDLLTHEFDNFIASIDWVAPKPTTFRINLKNDFNFYLIFSKTSWIAQVEGKKYYLLNLPEEERAVSAISRILRYGTPESSSSDGEESSEVESGDEEVDVNIDDTTDIDI